MILEIIEKSINFVVTVLAALKLKIAAYQGESFAFIRFPQKSKKYFRLFKNHKLFYPSSNF
jgi:hypothetical protein